MTMVKSKPVFVGIDVGKETFDYCLRPGGEAGTLPCTSEGIGELLALLLRQSCVELIVMEATGGYEKKIARELLGAKLQTAIVNPRQIRNFAKASGRQAKNDRLDAEVIAHFAEGIRPEVRPLPSAELEVFMELVARRQQLIGCQTAEKNRLHTARGPKVRKSINAMLKLLKQQLAELDDEIDRTIENSPVWRVKSELLQSMPGVGETTARVLLAECPELGELNRHEAAALIGLAPYDHDSGKCKGLRCISGGRATVRSALYMAALSATRVNERMRRFFQRLRKAGKPFKVAITACMRKLLLILNAILKTGQPWRENQPLQA